MAYYDYTSAFGPGKPGRIVAFVGESSQKDKEAMALNRAIDETATRLIKAYEEILSPSSITKAKTNIWGKRSVEEYENYFLSNVLFDYRIWEVDEKWLNTLRGLISKHNPEWFGRFLKDKELKLSKIER